MFARLFCPTVLLAKTRLRKRATFSGRAQASFSTLTILRPSPISLEVPLRTVPRAAQVALQLFKDFDFYLLLIIRSDGNLESGMHEQTHLVEL